MSTDAHCTVRQLGGRRGSRLPEIVRQPVVQRNARPSKSAKLKEARLKLKEAGICINCMKRPAYKGSTRCKPCKLYQARRYREKTGQGRRP